MNLKGDKFVILTGYCPGLKFIKKRLGYAKANNVQIQGYNVFYYLFSRLFLEMLVVFQRLV